MMARSTRNEFFLGRAKILSEFEEGSNSEQQLEHHLAEFFCIVRKREQLYLKFMAATKRNLGEQPSALQALNSTIMLLEDCNRKIRDCSQQHMTLIERKTYQFRQGSLTYNFCTRLVELLDALKDKLKGEVNLGQLVQHQKQQILRRYKRQMLTGDFNLHDISNAMAEFSRPIMSTPAHKRTLPADPKVQESRSSLVRSTQMLSNRQRDHLIKFVQLKQKEQQRKAKIEQQNNTEMKILRKRAKRLYKMMECSQLMGEQFQPTLTRQENVQELVAIQLARNAGIQQQITQYRQRYEEKGADSHCAFRIKKKMTPPVQRKSAFLASPME